ncbi:MAG: DUF6263 family protein [Pirellulales bacterium]
MRSRLIFRRLVVVVSLVILSCAATAVRAADEPIRWKFTAGEVLDFSMDQDMNMNIQAGPAAQMTTTAEQTMNMSWNIKSVDDAGNAEIEQRFKRIQLKMTVPGGQGLVYDTDSTEPAVGMAAMIAPTMEAMTAGSFTFKMTPRGEISDVKFSEELQKAIKGGPGGEAAGAEQFKSMVSQVAFVLPENAPKPGETWKTTVTVNNPAGGNQTVDTTYTFDGTREADGTTFAVIKPSMNMQLAKNPMMEMKMKEQKTDGEVLFDLKAGRLHSMSVNLNITLDMIAQQMTMPGTIDQKIEVKVTPGDAKAAEAPTQPAAAKEPAEAAAK